MSSGSRSARALSTLAVAALVLVLIASARVARACGGEWSGCWTTFERNPDVPLEEFAAGRIGLVRPEWARSYLVVAWRNLSGRPLEPCEQAAAVRTWKRRLALEPSALPEDAIAAWMLSRAAVPGVAPVDAPSALRYEPASYSSMSNCHEDAFVSAQRTLAARIAELGADSPEVRSWVVAQDAVFAACDGEGAPPEPLPAASAADAASATPTATWRPLARQDRAYQIAAALLYLGRNDEAAAAFDAIARDAASPWRVLAPYLAERARLRSLLPAAWPLDDGTSALLLASRERLGAMTRDEAPEATQAAARRLTARLDYWLRPGARLGELGTSLATPSCEDFDARLVDATWLLDRAIGDGWSDRVTMDLAAARKRSELLDWVLTVQRRPGIEAGHAVARWKEERSEPWLVAALLAASPSDADVPALLHAAAKVPAGSPARGSVGHESVRLLHGLGRIDEARLAVTAALADSPPATLRNHLLAWKARRATSMDEWWSALPRLPAGCGTSDDPTGEGAAEGAVPVLAEDGTPWLSRGLPTRILIDAAMRRDLLPAEPRRRVARAAFTRAAVLGDEHAMLAACAAAAAVEPPLAETAESCVPGLTAPRRQLVALLAVLRHPAHQEDMPWAVRPSAAAGSLAGTWREPPLALLGESDRALAASEDAALPDLDGRKTAVFARVMSLAEDEPGMPEIPEALHLLVRATRHAGGRGEMSAWSKRAFDVLHRSYPQSPWTKKTPHWY